MKAAIGRPGEFPPGRGEAPGSYRPGAPVWEPYEGLDALFPDASADPGTNDDED